MNYKKPKIFWGNLPPVFSNKSQLKRILISANQVAIINKKIEQAIMNRLKLRNKFLKKKSIVNKKSLYRKQREKDVLVSNGNLWKNRRSFSFGKWNNYEKCFLLKRVIYLPMILKIFQIYLIFLRA